MDDQPKARSADDHQRPRDGALGLTTACGAKTRKGGICDRPSMANGRCAMHGGKAAKGIRNGNFQHGRRSKALAKLDEDLGDRVSDPALLDPRRTLAVQEATLARLNEMLEQKDSPEFRELIRKRLGEAMGVMREDPREGVLLLRQVQEIANRGVDESRALTALGNAADLMNKSQNRYWQTAMTAARSISPEEFIQLMFRMADIIEEEVDKDAARRILGRTDREVCAGALGLSEQ